MRILQLVALGWALVAAPCEAREVPAASIVFGSFSSRGVAENALARFQTQIDLQLRIHEVEINKRNWFRVTSQMDTALNDVESTLRVVRETIIPGAWVLRSTLEVSGELAVRELAAKVRVASSATTPAADENQTAGSPVKKMNLRLQSESSQQTPVSSLDAIVLSKIANAGIDVDGKLTESAWGSTPVLDTFFVVDPDTLDDARFNSEVKMFYTDKGLYIATINQQPLDTLVPRLSSRDSDINRDGISITLDTSGEGLYGLWFGINLGGSLIDGTVLPEKQFSVQWDGPWYGESAVTENGYSTEMFLPWSMMAMPDTGDDRRMGIYARRRVAHIDEEWGYPALPKTGSKMMSAMQPIEIHGVRPSRQFAVFPFSAATYDNMENETKYRLGADIFWRPSTNLQLTATLNPDFGAIESDDVVVNLTAFETFFPEKRLFFLEGSDIFITSPRSNVTSSSPSVTSGTGARRSASSFRGEPTTLFNSRRIGGAPISPTQCESGSISCDTKRGQYPSDVSISAVQLGKPSDLMGAVKLTGQQGPFRYGVLAASEEDTKFKGEDAIGNPVRVEQLGRDFGILRFLYENANKGRRSLGWMTTAAMHPGSDAYVHGLDVHYQTASRRWNLDGQFMYSDVDNLEGFGSFFDLDYIPKRGLFHRFSIDYLDDTLDINNLGFIRRNDSVNFRYAINITNSNLKKLRSRSHSVFFSQEYNTDWFATRSGIFWRSIYTFHSRNAINTQLAYFPTRWDDRNSDGNGSFRIHDRWVGELSWGTDSSRKVSLSLFAGLQQEELSGWNYSARVGVTYKPNDRFSFDLDADFMRRHGWLLHQTGREFTTFDARIWQPRISMDVFLTAKQQIRFTMQWIGMRAEEMDFYLVPVNDGDLIADVKAPGAFTDDFAISRITAQLRYRWEIAPLSDLFLVYTRGSSHAVLDDEFSDLFRDALTDPVLDFFVVKLRYRFGN